MRSLQVSPFARDLIVTAATSATGIACTLLLTRFLAVGLGPTEFGAYSVVRRVIPTVLAFSTLAAEVAMPRYLGLASGQDSPSTGYLASSVLIVTATTGLALAVAALWREGFTQLFFADPAYETLIGATCVMAGATALFRLLYAHYRGKLQMAQANAWQLVSVALSPLIIGALWTSGATAARMVLLLTLPLLPAAAILVAKAIPDFAKARRLHVVRTTAVKLLRYGVPRVPGVLAFTALLGLGPMLAARLYGLASAADFSIGQSLFRAAEGAVGAFGVVALPHFARRFGAGGDDSITSNVSDLVALVFHLGLFVTVQVWIWADILVSVWLGGAYAASVPLTRVLILGFGPYLAYSLLHSVINAVEVRAVNTRNEFAALAVAAGTSLALAALHMGVLGLAIGSTVGFALLGILTAAYLKRRFRFSWRHLMPLRIAAANVAFAGLAWGAHELPVQGHGEALQLAALAACELILFGSYLALLHAWRVNWIHEVLQRVGVGRAAD